MTKRSHMINKDTTLYIYIKQYNYIYTQIYYSRNIRFIKSPDVYKSGKCEMTLI